MTFHRVVARRSASAGAQVLGQALAGPLCSARTVPAASRNSLGSPAHGGASTHRGASTAGCSIWFFRAERPPRRGYFGAKVPAVRAGCELSRRRTDPALQCCARLWGPRASRPGPSSLHMTGQNSKSSPGGLLSSRFCLAWHWTSVAVRHWYVVQCRSLQRTYCTRIGVHFIPPTTASGWPVCGFPGTMP